MSRPASLAVMLVALAGCGGKKQPKLRADTLAHLTHMVDSLSEVPPREVAEVVFQELVASPGLFAPTCAEVLDGFLNWKPADRGQRFWMIRNRCAVRCPIDKDMDALERSQRAEAMRTLTRACDARGADLAFGGTDRDQMDLLDYASMRFVLEHTRAALEADGSSQAKQTWSRLAEHIPALAKLLTPARVYERDPPLPAPQVAAPPAPAASPANGKLVTSVSGGQAEPEDPSAVPAAAIAARIRSAYMGGVRACYEHGLAENPDLGGRLTIEFTIEALGVVHHAKVVNSDLASETVEQCLVESAQRWAFSKPTSGQAVKVTYPFIFRASKH